VVHARVHERLLDPVAVDRQRRLVRVLLDDRKQVAEQPPSVSVSSARATSPRPSGWGTRSTGGREAANSAEPEPSSPA
jgi:hypothetical protein